MENYKGEIWVSQPDDKQDSIFRRGEIIEKVKDTENSTIYKVKLKDNDELVDADLKNIHKANPIRFDGYDDMASLTYLNEPSILNNLKVRYQDDKIYTHSGLFLVTVNPYKKINIYNSDFITLYSANEKKCNQPHIFGTAQKAFDNQSILVTGESGAGKTENTKRVIQYILSVATNVENKQSAAVLENQILQANPILESFGNATTVRNLNSSRFGKFVKIQIDSSNSQLVGAHVDYYLLEKSRVIFQDSNERNYHVFYQLLKGAPLDLLERLHLNNKSLNQYEYLKSGLTTPVGNIDDKKEFQNLINAFKIMSFDDDEVLNIFKILAIILHLGNIKFKNSLNDTKQAVLLDESNETIEKLLFFWGEIVNQQRTAAQAKFSIDALSKSLYEKLFQYLIDNINRSFNSSTNQNEFMDISDNYIGILDIAGFEIFKKNSFEQLCINYTNEKLQQFFNHHMFELEQSEYMKEGISWNYIDFGNELKPTIELIEGSQSNKRKTNIFSILDEECVVPKGTDKSFIDKLFSELESKDTTVDKNNLSFKPNKIRDGFIIKHYAGSVDYSVDGWLDKNKDPLSSTMVELLSNSNDIFVNDFVNASITEFNITDSPVKGSPRKKTGMFRTAAQRHKEQLNLLMDNLSQTFPHFVRCILPNSEKKPGVFNDAIVLHQLRCNGVLEGIRIARSGYPNRIDFENFAKQYSILSNASFNKASGIKNSTADYKKICEIILGELKLDPEVYKVGVTKLFFRNSVLASLEKVREQTLSSIFSILMQLNIQRLRASKVLAKNFKHYSLVKDDPWFKLINTLKPRLDDVGVVEAQYTNRIAKLENQVKEMKRDEIKSKLGALNKEIVEDQKTISAKDFELGELKQAKVLLEKELANLKITTDEKTSILKEKEQEIDKLSNTNSDLINKLENDNKALVDSKKSLEATIEQLKCTIDKNELEISSMKRDKKSKDTAASKKIDELQCKLSDAISESSVIKAELDMKSKTLAEKIALLDDLQSKKKLSERLKKEFKELKHKYKQLKSNHEQRIQEEVNFNSGLIDELKRDLEMEKKNSVDLSLRLDHAKLETERELKNKKSLEMEVSQLKLRLRSTNPDQAELSQLEHNRRSDLFTPDMHRLIEEARSARTRLAADSKNESEPSEIKIFNDHDEVDELRERLRLEKESNKRWEERYVQLQKQSVINKTKNARESIDIEAYDLLSTDSMEYKNKYQMARIEIDDLKEQLKELRIEAKRKPVQKSNVLADTTNIENRTLASLDNNKSKGENLRLKSELMSLKTKLNRLESGNTSRFEQEEEIIQLKNHLKTLELSNSSLQASKEIYKDRSEDYYAKLNQVENELHSSKILEAKLKEDISHLKSQANIEFEINKLNDIISDLKDKLQCSEDLRKSVKSVSYDYHENEIERLKKELVNSVNKESEMNGFIKSMNAQLETLRNKVNAEKSNSSQLNEEKNKLARSLKDCALKNEELCKHVEENINKAQSLTQQVNALKVTTADLTRERDELFAAKRDLEDKIRDINSQFEDNLMKAKENAHTVVLNQQLTSELNEARQELSEMRNKLSTYENNLIDVTGKLELKTKEYLKAVEDNKKLVKFNSKLESDISIMRQRYDAELKAQDDHWSKRVSELDEKLRVFRSSQLTENYKINELNGTIRELEAQNQNLEHSKKHLKDVIRHLEANVERLQISYENSNKREAEAQTRSLHLSNQLDKLRESLGVNI
ncbi:hypothetical protein CAS74_000235 [Pichia kudriavzevii]|uniref:Myosin motor domain-containing protein n=1 Tax=Pichia kudriavzevii TaxID=4909 RepID=A0A1Z8JTE9_PICKU|nr:hypothetical protein CAS74_000235 [Pichia kudriavzevii]